MDSTDPTRPTTPRWCGAQRTAEPDTWTGAGGSSARGARVRAAVCAWNYPAELGRAALAVQRADVPCRKARGWRSATHAICSLGQPLVDDSRVTGQPRQSVQLHASGHAGPFPR